MRDVSRNTADILELYEIFWRVSMKYQDEFRKEYFEKLKKEGYELNGQIFVQIEKDLYIEWLETKLQNTSSNKEQEIL